MSKTKIKEPMSKKKKIILASSIAGGTLLILGTVFTILGCTVWRHRDDPVVDPPIVLPDDNITEIQSFDVTASVPSNRYLITVITKENESYLQSITVNGVLLRLQNNDRKSLGDNDYQYTYALDGIEEEKNFELTKAVFIVQTEENQIYNYDCNFSKKVTIGKLLDFDSIEYNENIDLYSTKKTDFSIKMYNPYGFSLSSSLQYDDTKIKVEEKLPTQNNEYTSLNYEVTFLTDDSSSQIQIENVTYIFKDNISFELNKTINYQIVDTTPNITNIKFENNTFYSGDYQKVIIEGSNLNNVKSIKANNRSYNVVFENDSYYILLSPLSTSDWSFQSMTDSNDKTSVIDFKSTVNIVDYPLSVSFDQSNVDVFEKESKSLSIDFESRYDVVSAVIDDKTVKITDNHLDYSTTDTTVKISKISYYSQDKSKVINIETDYSFDLNYIKKPEYLTVNVVKSKINTPIELDIIPSQKVLPSALKSILLDTKQVDYTYDEESNTYSIKGGTFSTASLNDYTANIQFIFRDNDIIEANQTYKIEELYTLKFGTILEDKLYLNSTLESGYKLKSIKLTITNNKNESITFYSTNNLDVYNEFTGYQELIWNQLLSFDMTDDMTLRLVSYSVEDESGQVYDVMSLQEVGIN